MVRCFLGLLSPRLRTLRAPHWKIPWSGRAAPRAVPFGQRSRCLRRAKVTPPGYLRCGGAGPASTSFPRHHLVDLTAAVPSRRKHFLRCLQSRQGGERAAHSRALSLSRRLGALSDSRFVSSAAWRLRAGRGSTLNLITTALTFTAGQIRVAELRRLGVTVRLPRRESGDHGGRRGRKRQSSADAAASSDVLRSCFISLVAAPCVIEVKLHCTSGVVHSAIVALHRAAGRALSSGHGRGVQRDRDERLEERESSMRPWSSAFQSTKQELASRAGLRDCKRPRKRFDRLAYTLSLRERL